MCGSSSGGGRCQHRLSYYTTVFVVVATIIIGVVAVALVALNGVAVVAGAKSGS